MKRFLLICNIILTIIRVIVLASGCTTSDTSDLYDAINLNREYILELREHTQAIEEYLNESRQGSLAMAERIDSNSKAILDMAEGMVTLGEGLEEWSDQLEPAIEEYVDWYIEYYADTVL